ncbi:MAG: glycerol-3-phosphate dehydrogenase/oxidase [Pseudomonadota bacterium]
MTLGTRAAALDRLMREPHWDVVIVGGGITGAGVLREAARRGLKALLLEQRDYAWGTSSRSSKMVHGGLRYIAQGDFRLTRDALLERERMLREAPGLVERMGYLFPVRCGQFPGRWSFSALLALYDLLAGIRDHRWLPPQETVRHAPGLKTEHLRGGCRYTDAVTDDARLVLRVLQDAVADGGVAVNHVRVLSLLRDTALTRTASVRGVVVEDTATRRTWSINADVVINATGAWADRLRGELVPEKRIRPLRGSHIVVAHERLPVTDALTLLHPRDRRPVFVFPWEGRTVIGTTDLDHGTDLDIEASITRGEAEYLYDAVASQFGGARLGDADVISSWAGVRPVIGSDHPGKRARDPSKERRDHAVWADDGLVTVSGGKLTTFRLIALDALRAAEPWSRCGLHVRDDGAPVFAPAPGVADIAVVPAARRRLLAGRYGAALTAYCRTEGAADVPIAGTPYSFADLLWSLRNEQVLHLDDLLLRRTRLGNLLRNGARELLPELQPHAMRELGWDEARWETEVARYLDIWQKYYSLPAA